MAVTFVLVFLLAAGSTNARELPPLVVAPFGTVRLYMPQEPPPAQILLPGGHHFDGNYPAIAAKILTSEFPASTGH
jgi:hypothetical protein